MCTLPELMFTPTDLFVELNETTLTMVMHRNNLTRVQVRDLWSKLVSFNMILLRKYGNTYTDNMMHILNVEMPKYQQKVLQTYKKKHPKKPISTEIEQEHRDALQLDEWRRGTCPDKVREYLDKELPGWRDFERYVDQLFNI